MVTSTCILLPSLLHVHCSAYLVLFEAACSTRTHDEVIVGSKGWQVLQLIDTCDMVYK